MRSSLFNDLCSDYNIQNRLFFLTFKNFVNHVLRQAKQSSRNTIRWVSFVKICNQISKRTIHYHINDSETIYRESSHVLTDPKDKLEHKIEVFQYYYVLSFNESNLNSLLFVISALGASFRGYREDSLVSSDADRCGHNQAKGLQYLSKMSNT